MAVPLFKLTFDNPDTYCMEAGAYHMFHVADFTRSEAVFANMYQDPNTGFIFHKPSVLTTDFYKSGSWLGKDKWNVQDSKWESIKRSETSSSADGVSLLGSVMNGNGGTVAQIVETTRLAPGSGGFTLVNMLVVVALIAILETADVLVPVAETKVAELAQDESFEIHFRFEADPHIKFTNLLYVLFDNIGIHISADGLLSVYYYYPANPNTPVLFDSFQFAKNGNLAHTDVSIMIIPIPGYGLSITSNTHFGKTYVNRTSANTESVSGRLVKVPQKTDSDGYQYNYDSTKITVFMIPMDAVLNSSTDFKGLHTRYQFGLHKITFGGTGKVMSPIFDIGHKFSNPSIPATSFGLSQNPNRFTSNTTSKVLSFVSQTATNQNIGTPTNTLPALTQKAKFLITSTISGGRCKYTTFFTGAQFWVPPVFMTRDTTAVETKWSDIEFSVDDMGLVAGVATTYSFDEQTFKIAKRGDTTWRLQHTVDSSIETPVWKTIGGGIATSKGSAYLTSADINHGGFQTDGPSPNIGMFKTEWELISRQYRMTEVFQFLNAAFDGFTLGEVINTVLYSAGETRILDAEFPSIFVTQKLPEPENGLKYKWASNPGDSGLKIIEAMLMLAKKQFVEYQMYFDWPTLKWKIVAKDRDSTSQNKYWLTPFEDEFSMTHRKRVVFPAESNFHSFPPEANAVQAISLTDPSDKAKQISSPNFVNISSLYDVTSLDYIGRLKVSKVMAEEVGSQKQIDIIGRKVFDYASKWEGHVKLLSVGYDPSFSPINPPYCVVRAVNWNGARIDLLTGWLKRKIVKVTGGQCGKEFVTYIVGSRWETIQKTQF